jgi:hypothetical protein
LGFSLKSLLPIAGAAAGFFLGGPAGSAAMNAALGSGIGTLLGGGDLEDAVKNSILAGGAGMGLGALGVQGAGAAGAAAAGSGASTATGISAANKQILEDQARMQAGQLGAKQAAKQGIFGTGITGGDIYLGSSLLSLLEEPEEVTGGESNPESRPDYKGTPIAGLFVDPETDIKYDTAEERDAAIEARRRQQQNMAMGGIVSLNEGGYVEGPGTGTSDSIKAGIYQNGKKVQEARLSDGEFVFKEKSVVGAGNGDRELGAKRLYAMMDKFERMA